MSATRVLVIDDDPDFVEFMRIVLETNGYDVSCAYNADHGLELLRTERPDIVLLDIMMSYSMAGLQVTRAMREDLELSRIPLIVISSVLPGAQALDDQEDLASIAAFLTKPVEPSELLHLIAETIAQNGNKELE
jgi:CheY-like chemotaxis protein